MKNYQAKRLIIQFLFWLVSFFIIGIINHPNIFYTALDSLALALMITVFTQILKAILHYNKLRR